MRMILAMQALWYTSVKLLQGRTLQISSFVIEMCISKVAIADLPTKRRRRKKIPHTIPPSREWLSARTSAAAPAVVSRFVVEVARGWPGQVWIQFLGCRKTSPGDRCIDRREPQWLQAWMRLGLCGIGIHWPRRSIPPTQRTQRLGRQQLFGMGWRRRSVGTVTGLQFEQGSQW